MIASRIKSGLLFGLLGLLVGPAFAQTPAIQTPTMAAPLAQTPDQIPYDGRDASFLPPGTPSAQPAPLPSSASTTPATPITNTTSAAPVNAPPAVSSPAVPMPAAPETVNPVQLSQPVQSETLQSIDPDSIGLLTAEGGGLGAAMWKGTSLDLVTRVLPELVLPTNSAALNGLAQRFLLTTANVPEGTNAGAQTLTSMRVEKLVALGDTVDAWNFAFLKPDRMDENTLRLVTEAALLGDKSKDVCAKLPDIIRAHTAPDWQKSLVTCQLEGGDTKGAQLGLEVLHTQGVKDDVFFELAEHNIIGGSKSLPRQLTPLKPLNLALLQIIGEPLPPELFVHPDAVEIPDLLQAKARDEALRLGLAERAAARSIIGSTQLAAAYRAAPFSADQVTSALNSSENGPRLRALLYQAIIAEKDPQRHLNEVSKFVASLDTIPLNNATATLLAEGLGDIPATGDYTPVAPVVAHVLLMASRPQEALAWLKIARQTSALSVAADLQNFWPLAALAGLESDSDYSQNLHAWIAAWLKDTDHDRREQIGNVLSLLEAAGFAVPEDVWAQVVDVAAAERRAALPSILLLDRLRAASEANRRGETVLLALAATNAGPNDTSPLPAIETVRALRLVGLTADSLMLARETVSSLLAASRPVAKP